MSPMGPSPSFISGCVGKEGGGKKGRRVRRGGKEDKEKGEGKKGGK